MALSGRLGRHFDGLERRLIERPGARSTRVVHPADQTIGEHRHELACLTIHVLGGYSEQFEGGEVSLDGPGAVFHPAGSAHANRIGPWGLETVSIEFDPAWLAPVDARAACRAARVWAGGPASAAAAALGRLWSTKGSPEAILRRALADFLRTGASVEPHPAPRWLESVKLALAAEPAPETRDIAARLDLHPATLARGYKAAVGEGLHVTVRRRRVERAMGLLRRTDLSLVEIALDAGFCDQSHMNRALRSIAGRTPLEVRAEAQHLGARAVQKVA